LITKKQQIEYRRSIVEKFLIRGKSTRAIVSLLEKDYKIPVCQQTIINDKKSWDNQLMEQKRQHIENLPIVLERIKAGVGEVLDLCWTLADNVELDPKSRLAAASLINDSYRLTAELHDGSIDIDNLSSMLARTKDKAEDIADAKKQEQVF
jgi:hypothetical protein